MTGKRQQVRGAVETESAILRALKARNYSGLIELEHGWSEQTQACEQRGIEPYIATGRQAHHQSWQTFFATQGQPPPDTASPKVKMAYQLQTEIGREIYRLRKCTVEPVIGIIKEVLGFRQFSLRGLCAAAGEWSLVCLAFNLKRLHVLCPQACDA